jgi:drug/metabolite transporter (DMT)-like permease
MDHAHLKPSLIVGIFLTIGAYFFFAISSTCVRELKSISSMEIIFFQSFIPLLCLLLFSRKGLNILSPVSIPAHLVRDLFGIASFFAYFQAIKYIDLIDATVLSYTAPFYIPMIWSIWAKEKINKEVWWVILLGFIGILFILKPGTSIFKISSFLGITSGIFSSLSLTAIGILNRKKESMSNIMFYFFFISTIISMPFTFFSWSSPSLTQWLLLLSIGITNFFAQIFLTKAYSHGTASYLSPLSYTIVVFTSFFSWIIFNKPPGLLSFAGMIFIIVGGSLTYILKKKPANLSEVFEVEGKKPWWKFWN